MKNLLTLMIITLWAAVAQAQGTFTFSNHVPAAGVDSPVFDGWPGRPSAPALDLVAGPNMVAGVFLNGVQLGTPAVFRTGEGAGYWNPGANPIREVPGKFAGDVVAGFTVKVWDSSKGATMEMARDSAGKFGESKVFSVTLGGPKPDPLLPSDLPGVMSNFQSFALNIPEPSVLALGALGVVVYVFGRRGKPPA